MGKKKSQRSAADEASNNDTVDAASADASHPHPIEETNGISEQEHQPTCAPAAVNGEQRNDCAAHTNGHKATSSASDKASKLRIDVPSSDRMPTFSVNGPSPVKPQVHQKRDWQECLRHDLEHQKHFKKSSGFRNRMCLTAIFFGILSLIHFCVVIVHRLLLELPQFLGWWLNKTMMEAMDHTPTPTAAQNAEVASKLGLNNGGLRTRAAVVNTTGVEERLKRFISCGEVQIVFNKEGLSPLPKMLTPGCHYDGWLWYRHFETIFANLRPFAPHLYTRESFTSWDGCTLCLDWAFARTTPTNPTPKGVILCIPGLASSGQTPYIECFSREITRSGYHCAVLNARGMGTTPLDVPRVVDGYNTNDIRYAIRFLDAERLEAALGIPSSTPLFVVGHSLGGSLVCKYLGEEGLKLKLHQDDPIPSLDRIPPSRVTAALAVDVPWDFHGTHHHMMRFESLLIYQQHLTDGLVEYLQNHIHQVRNIKDFEIDVLLKRGLRKVQDYDEHIASPHLGFSCKEEYYTKSQSREWLQYIRVPTLCLSGRNDPIIGKPLPDTFWEKVVATNPYITYVCTPTGGHLAFLQGYMAELQLKGNPMERMVCSYFDEILIRSGVQNAASKSEGSKKRD